jgi:hypothetical protein
MSHSYSYVRVFRWSHAQFLFVYEFRSAESTRSDQLIESIHHTSQVHSGECRACIRHHQRCERTVYMCSAVSCEHVVHGITLVSSCDMQPSQSTTQPSSHFSRSYSHVQYACSSSVHDLRTQSVIIARPSCGPLASSVDRRSVPSVRRCWTRPGLTLSSIGDGPTIDRRCECDHTTGSINRLRQRQTLTPSIVLVRVCVSSAPTGVW